MGGLQLFSAIEQLFSIKHNLHLEMNFNLILILTDILITFHSIPQVLTEPSFGSDI